MTPLGQLGMQIAGQAAGGIMGMALGSYNDKRQLKQQEKLQELQIKGQKEIADHNLKRQMNMWEMTNYEAQVKKMKEAGLNPAMLYGGSGAGGAIAGSPAGSVSGAMAPSGGGEIQSMAGMGMQMAQQAQMTQAQIELMQAQTNKTNVEAEKTAGVDTAESKARIDNLLQGIDNARQQHEIQKLEITLKNIENFEKQATQKDRMAYIMYQTRMAMKQLEIVENEAFISDETYNQKVEIIRAEAIGAALKNEVMKSGIAINSAQMKKWATELSQGWEGLDQKAQELKIKNFEAEFKAQYPSIMNTLGGQLDNFLNSIKKLTTGRGFDKHHQIDK